MDVCDTADGRPDRRMQPNEWPGGPGPLMNAVNGRAQCATAVIVPMEAAWIEISRRLMLREVL